MALCNVILSGVRGAKYGRLLVLRHLLDVKCF
jgi:hypothetical protein